MLPPRRSSWDVMQSEAILVQGRQADKITPPR
jgi:hypothetical protein